MPSTHTPKRCPLCGSDDPQKADDLMAALGNYAPVMTPARMKTLRTVSALRMPHMNRECVKGSA